MKVSYKWLQTYFDKKLPAPEKLVDLFTFHSFEVEGLDKVGDDFVIDAKILPDRAHYALSHRGVATEVAALTDLSITKKQAEDIPATKTRELTINIKNDSFCPRYIGRVAENIQVVSSPTWLKESLEAIGARSINTIVDATNYVMFDVGQPLHAFDADKVVGTLTIRSAEEGEKITILDGREIILKSTDTVIADNEGPLAIAGIKGGKRAEVTTATKHIILEAANFNATAVRKTATRIGIRNDSSKRFENAITPELAMEAMRSVCDLISKLSPGAQFGEVMDQYKNKVANHQIKISAEYISQKLGADIGEAEIISILQKLDIGVEKKASDLVLTIPFTRLDLVIREDVVEEVGRIYGYEKIGAQLPARGSEEIAINKTFYYAEKVKDILTSLGISEVYLYTLTAKGHHEVAYPLASDKSALRTNLTDGLVKALAKNAENAPLLNLSKIKLFEIGKVFPKEGEYTSLVIGVKHTRKFKGETTSEDIRQIREQMLHELGSKAETLCTVDDSGGIIVMDGKPIGQINNAEGILELNLDKLVEKLPEPKRWDIDHKPLKDVVYKPLSVYPFITRDIAFFAPADVAEGELEALIKKLAAKSGLLQTMYLFDKFEKKQADGSLKKSLAYRLVFQSLERTLEDAEVNTIMDAIYTAVKDKGCEVR